MLILDIYIGKTLLRHILVTIVVLLGLFTFVSFIDELSDLDMSLWNCTDRAVRNLDHSQDPV